MRLLAIGFVLLVLLLAWLAFMAHQARMRRVWAAAEASARWESGQYSKDGVIHVVVRRVARLPSGETREIESVPVATIVGIDAEWHERFAIAKQTAYDRAIDLNWQL